VRPRCVLLGPSVFSPSSVLVFLTGICKECRLRAVAMNLFFDMARLSIRMFRRAPTGIDRVEYAYAKELLNLPETTGVFTTPLFVGALRKTRALDLLQRVERAWGLGPGPAEDAAFQHVQRWLEASPDPEAKRTSRFHSHQGAISLVREAGFFPAHDFVRASARLNRWVDRSAPKPAVYFHCSHAQLDQMRRFEWLARKKLRSVFFVHDVIPIEYPEFCSPGAYGRHVQRLMTVSKLASLAIVNSDESRRAVRRALADRGARAPDMEVVPLGVDDAFLGPSAQGPVNAQSPYFLCVGTIEPRKNLLFYWPYGVGLSNGWARAHRDSCSPAVAAGKTRISSTSSSARGRLLLSSPKFRI
jgi:glycosyltransferase involved in cell wall biosynthesis